MSDARSPTDVQPTASPLTPEALPKCGLHQMAHGALADAQLSGYLRDRLPVFAPIRTAPA